jgi:hypothetical protein
MEVLDSGEVGVLEGFDAGGAPGIQICEGVVSRGEILRLEECEGPSEVVFSDMTRL